MLSRFFGVMSAASAVVWCGAAPAAEPAPFLKPGDRVVLIGETLIEREQASGHWETAWVRHVPDLVVRNLGWSGDTPGGWARAGFGKPDDGFAQLLQQIEQVQPTVILLGYGMNASFETESNAADFRKSLDRLLDRVAVTGRRTVICSPIRHEGGFAAGAFVESHNRRLDAYRDLLRDTAEKRRASWIDLLAEMDRQGPSPARPWTTNGIHLTDDGYRRTALAFERAWGAGPAPAVTIDVAKNEAVATGTRATELKAAAAEIAVKLQDEALPPAGEAAGWKLTIAGLKGGRYRVLVDGAAQAEATAEQLAAGTVVPAPDGAATEKLRQAIVAKNSLYFHRWRPQNWTYLFGFRKHEQGRNAVEVPQFEELVKAREAEIAKLRVPPAHRLTVVPAT